MSRPGNGLPAAAAGFLAISLLTVTAAARPPAENLPFNDTILVYADGGRDWGPGSFEYYLAYVDRDGTPRDRLFDGFLFLAITAKSKQNFWDGKATSADWDWWFEKLFEPGRQLDALEADARALEGRLGPAAPRRVIISVPRPPVAADAAGQEAVVKEFVDRCVRRFAERDYRHIALDGFYWFHEGVDGTNADLVNALAGDLRGRGLRLYWIPYDVGHENRPHLEKWQAGEIRFDFVWLQPNFFWADRNEKYAAQDLDDTVSVARARGAGVEIEFDHGARTTGWKLGRYTHYLMSADVYGYRRGPLAYYDGYQGFIKCGQTRNPVQRAVYDDLYWFIRKAYLPKPLTYPGVFYEPADGQGPGAQPEIGLWLEKGGKGRILLVEPDPNKDQMMVLKTTGTGKAKLEALAGGSWTALEGPAAGGPGPARLERYRLPRGLIQAAWRPAPATPGPPGKRGQTRTPPLVVELRRTGEGEVEAAWARPDDFVFRYAGGKQPMETELRLDLDGRAATLRNAFGETMIGLRAAGAAAPEAGFEVDEGAGRRRRVAFGSSGGTEEFVWAKGQGGREGNLGIRLDPGVEIGELLAFPAGTSFHLRAGSSGDTRADLHVPGISLVPDGKWRLAGEFGRNHRTGDAGAALRVSAPPVAQAWALTLLLEAAAGGRVEVLREGNVEGDAEFAGGPSRRVSLELNPGECIVRFSGAVALHDAWLFPR